MKMIVFPSHTHRFSLLDLPLDRFPITHALLTHAWLVSWRVFDIIIQSATNEALLSLSVRMNNIGDDGGKELLSARNKTLTHLNLSANKLGSSSAVALLQTLEKKPDDCALESIVMTSNMFAEEDLIHLSQCKTAFIDVRATEESFGQRSAKLARQRSASIT